ncbi:MAG TPA: tetratricopeptide repeat protein [Bacteroidia bacterium]|nr:tetratricopeptide repeat protein [Bacteroidia bacterium]
MKSALLEIFSFRFSLVLISAFCFPVFVHADPENDSLRKAFHEQQNDSLKINAAVTICMHYSSDLPDTCIVYADSALNYCKAKKLDRFIPILLKLKGVAFVNLSEYSRSLDCYFEGVDYAKRLKNEKEEAAILNNIGVNYWYQKEFLKAKNYYDQALTIRLRLGNKKDISKSYNNLGIISVELKKYQEALDFYGKAISLKDEIGDKSGCADCYNNIGIVYEELKNNDAALAAYGHALDIFKDLGDIRGQIVSLNNIAIIHKTNGDIRQAMDYAMQSLELSQSIDDKEDVKNAYELLAIASYNSNDYKAAYDYLQLFDKEKDTLYSMSKAEAMTEMEAKYLAKENKQKIDLQQAQIGEQQTVIDKGNIIRYGLYGLVALLVLISLLFINRYNIKRKTELEISAQKQVVENQKKMVEEKNAEIIDSIRYAERIQKALLPQQEKLKRIIPDSFVFYRPKDIVSGDFYWCEQWGDQSLFAAADCTGHGVPGAIISVVGHNLLNQAVNELGLSQPNLMLNSLDKGVAKVLRKQGEDGIVQDGMDISLVSLRKKGNKTQLDYSGAFNPLWVYKKAEGKMVEVKADKISIGTYDPDNFKSFTNHQMELESGDVVYIFSDGYADQFGGVNGKKFRYKNFQELLERNALLSMEQQKKNLASTIDAWRGPLEQVDDMLVIGVRI